MLTNIAMLEHFWLFCSLGCREGHRGIDYLTKIKSGERPLISVPPKPHAASITSARCRVVPCPPSAKRHPSCTTTPIPTPRKGLRTGRMFPAHYGLLEHQCLMFYDRFKGCTTGIRASPVLVRKRGPPPFLTLITFKRISVTIGERGLNHETFVFNQKHSGGKLAV